MQRDIGRGARKDSLHHGTGNGTNGTEVEELDVLIIGAGFAGCYLIHYFRKANFKTKIVEAAAGLGGVWFWNRYPGARVDTPYPSYALSIPEVWKDWYWSSKYPEHNELREYFAHMEKMLSIEKDCYLNTKVSSADFDAHSNKWTVVFEGGKTVRTTFLIPGIGFAAKRHFPDWEGFDSFKGTIHHSSFWPHEGVDVRGKKVAVVGTGATGLQIAQETAKEIGSDGSLTVFQRTPNIAFPMQQKKLTKAQQDVDREHLAETFKSRMQHPGGFNIDFPVMTKTFDATPEEREALYDKAFEEGGFGSFLSVYYDVMLDMDANREIYKYWMKRVRSRVHDPHLQELLAPTEWPHPVAGKRPSLEQDFYEQFNRPNVHLVSTRETPVQKVVPEGIVTSDGKLHEADIIALATGFDAVTGGIRDIAFRGADGELLTDHWKNGTRTYLGLTIHNFPNMFFLYGPQAPTAFSNGPSCVEPQADWIVQMAVDMREKSQTRIEATTEAEQKWQDELHDKNRSSIRKDVPGWYNGNNIPGKRVEPLNYSGGIPLYCEFLSKEREGGYAGFTLS